MARPLRLEHAGALWHVTCRGNEKARNLSRRARSSGLSWPDRSSRRGLFAWRLHAYVLMGNHYHLLVETPEPNLSRGMHQLNAVVYTGTSIGATSGWVISSRGDSRPFSWRRSATCSSSSATSCSTRSGRAWFARPEEWPWSNYLATAGLTPAPKWLETDWTIAQFGGGPLAGDRLPRVRGSRDVRPPDSWSESAQPAVSRERKSFQKTVQARIDSGCLAAEVPWAERHYIRPTLIRDVRVRRWPSFVVAPTFCASSDAARCEWLWRTRPGTKQGSELSDFAGWLAVGRRLLHAWPRRVKRFSKRDATFRARIDSIRVALRKVTL